MRIAVVSETSAADKNPQILRALEGRGHQIINAGMTGKVGEPELTYLHTGLLAALLLGSGRADLVVGGCGTGQGFLISCSQYGGVFCGLLLDPLDAWLFRQINGGNCVSLALNKAFGWAGEVNLRFLFDRFFEVQSGTGYPPHRRESQVRSRGLLAGVSEATHLRLSEVLLGLEQEVVMPVLSFPGVREVLDPETLCDEALRRSIAALLQRA